MVRAPVVFGAGRNITTDPAAATLKQKPQIPAAIADANSSLNPPRQHRFTFKPGSYTHLPLPPIISM